MRVIAGKRKHFTLKTLEGLSIRPTTDKIKETLFNMIQFELSNINFLDLYAGSGAIGIEALSRGAKQAVFVDNNVEAIKIIKENLKKTDFLDDSIIIHSDVVKAISNLNYDKIFHIVFMDPPYNQNLYIDTLKILSNKKFIDDETIFILEMDKNDNVDTALSFGYTIIKQKIYKNNMHLFLRKNK